MSEQAELFDAAATVPQPCPVPGCGAIRVGDQPKVVTCAHDLEPPDQRPYRRPRGCLNRSGPGELPEDF